MHICRFPFHLIDNSPLKTMVPQVVQLAKLYCVSPATTSTCERSFSQLRRMKSYLRATMTQQRLNHLLILTVYKEDVDRLDIFDLVKDFILYKESRRLTFDISPPLIE